MNENKDRILKILRATGRPGMEDVIFYLESSNYFTRGCYHHHKESGGLAQHSLEVYDYMLTQASGIPSDSIAIVALFHDLGKTRRGNGRGNDHGQRSLEILHDCGFVLTFEESIAIGQHHRKAITFMSGPLWQWLSWGDMNSTGIWKRAHRKSLSK